MQMVNHFTHELSKKPPGRMQYLLLYRVLSLGLSCLFFYLFGPTSSILFYATIIGSLVIVGWVVTKVQKKYEGNTKALQAIVMAELIGLTLLLIPTGGISSVFIWYALNPVLVAALFLSPVYCYAMLAIFLGTATWITQNVFQTDLLTIVQNNSYFYLVCILITLLVRLFSRLAMDLDAKAMYLKKQQKELLKINTESIKANMKYEERLEHILSLYHVVDTLSSNKNPEKLIYEINKTLMKCTQSTESFVWLTDSNHQKSHLANSTNNPDLEQGLKKEWHVLRGTKEAFIYTIHNQVFLMKVIRTSTNVGVLGVKSTSFGAGSLVGRTFEYIADLSEIMLERIHMDHMAGQMLVVEEQNRIANEIHDSVSQRLFGIVYSLHNLGVKNNQSANSEMNQEFKFLEQSANTTIKELRAAIYQLSSIKNGENSFYMRLKTYLDEYAKLYDIQINHQMIGNELLISDELQNALYRIVCEACGNAVRHGKCTTIELNLSVLENKTILAIQDDGLGITQQPLGLIKEKGIGLLNIERLVSAFSGTFSIDGTTRQGTELIIEIPALKALKEEEVAG
ncbi:sensor histidine kinase [Sporosarcina siberiensis]|uniref:Oxygen sensor histidine kinase NreB n=1 Tax=Sporosarcina siberiensis TaxID=1365606 RepID=A0ABW4SID9_9BACL